MTTQNRYYSMTAQATTLTNPPGINATETDVQVGASTGFPSSTPFVLIVEPDTTNMEAMLVTSGGGTASNPYQVTRGYDNTQQRAHLTGVPIVHGFVELDFAEPQQHLNQTSPTSVVHGLPASAWSGGSLQTIQAQVLASPGTFNFSVPAGFNHLHLKLAAASSDTGGNGFSDVALQFNGDTGSDYSWRFFYAVNSSTVQFINQTATTNIHAGTVANGGGDVQGNSLVGDVDIWINFYGVTNMTKGVKFQSNAASGVGSPNNFHEAHGGGIWGNNKAAVTSLLLQPSNSPNTFTAGSMCTLYGII